MSLNRWMVCLLASLLSFAVVQADEKKAEKKKEAEEKKEDKKEKREDKKEAKLPDSVKSAWDVRYKSAEIIESKGKKDSVEIKAKDKLNDEFEVVYGNDGKLWAESSHRVALANVPKAVLDAAAKWAPAAKWAEVQKVVTKKGEPTENEITGELFGKTIKAKFADDGKVIKADKLPEEKKKEEKKKEEKK